MSMILYNIRYRGPFEYDKFVLNILQFMNEVKRIDKKINKDTVSNLLKKKNELDNIFNELTNTNSDLDTILKIKEEI